MTAGEWVFTGYGIGSQLVLLAYFAARRWAPRLVGPGGIAAYVIGGLGLVVGPWLAASGASWRLWVGPVLMALWAAFGAYVDMWRAIPWRVPIRWSALVPYVVLYFFGQMFLWWPLLHISMPAWFTYTVLFVASTALNLAGHFGPREEPNAEAMTSDPGA